MSMMLIDQTKDSACKTAEADAIRAKTGGSAQIAYDFANNKGFADAIAAIPSGGGGGNTTIETGTFTLASAVGIYASGTTLTVGFSGQPDYIYIWLDRDSFDAIETPENNHYYRVALMKNDANALSTFPPIRLSASADIQTYFANDAYLRVISPNVFASSDSSTVNGYAVGALAFYDRYNANNAINNDGTIKIAKHSSASAYFYAGTYHYLAITGSLVFWVPA